MKNFSIIITFLTLSMGLFSCDKDRYVAPSTGAPYELVLFANGDVQKSTAMDTLRAALQKEVMWINRSEPLFDFIVLPRTSMRTLANRHRNVMILTLDTTLKHNVMAADTNVYSRGQVMIQLSSPSVDSMTDYIWQHRNTLSGVYHKYERDRFIRRVNKYHELGLEKALEKKFGFTMKIPRGYRLEEERKDFTWIAFQTELGSINIIFYQFKTPPTGDDWLLDERNVALSNVPGPSEGSYVTTEMMLRPETTLQTINGVNWYQTRGLWRVENDFMGGPFINYVTKVGDEYIGMDMFVQAPGTKEKQRNYIRQLEALPLTVKFK